MSGLIDRHEFRNKLEQAENTLKRDARANGIHDTLITVFFDNIYRILNKMPDAGS
jgi:hypothetical protein